MTGAAVAIFGSAQFGVRDTGDSHDKILFEIDVPCKLKQLQILLRVTHAKSPQRFGIKMHIITQVRQPT